MQVLMFPAWCMSAVAGTPVNDPPSAHHYRLLFKRPRSPHRAIVGER
jgi:hypothetical protein